LDFMNKNGSFQFWVFEQGITSDVVVACIDAFTESLKRPGVLVIDNTPIHTSLSLGTILTAGSNRG
jgi:hypothetical protein